MGDRAAQRRPEQGGTKPLDAVQIMKADHKQVRKLFERFHAAAPDEKAGVSRRLLAELELHTRLEEELIYPALQKDSGSLTFESPSLGNGLDHGEVPEEIGESERVNGMELVVEESEDGAEEIEELITAAYEEHQAMKDIMQQLRSLDPVAQEYQELLEELEETVYEHVSEEEAAILPLVADQLDVQAIGREMQRRKDDFQSQAPVAA